MTRKQAIAWLDTAQAYAKIHSTCTKTAVGCLILKDFKIVSKGANAGMLDCHKVGCLRKQLFGNNSKAHRDTCRCRHSEINALRKAKESVVGATAIVTRYPCDSCAKALAAAGIREVIYGREFEISDWAKTLFDSNNISVVHIPEWNCDIEDTNN